MTGEGLGESGAGRSKRQRPQQPKPHQRLPGLLAAAVGVAFAWLSAHDTSAAGWLAAGVSFFALSKLELEERDARRGAPEHDED